MAALTKVISLTYVAFALRTLVPLIVLPFLSYRLAPAEFGAVLAGQSLALTGVILLEWGFNLSGVRDLSAARDADAAAAVVARVLSARLALVPVVLAAVCLLAWATPVLGDRPGRVAATGVLALVIGFTPLWYFQGKSRPAFAAGLELLGAVLSLAAILRLVRAPDDVAPALLAMAAGPAVAYGWGTWRMRRESGRLRVSPREAALALRAGFPIFLVYASGSVQTVASTWLIAVLASAEAAAFYGVAHRLVNVLVAGSFEPIAQAAMPRSVRLAGEDPPRAATFALRLLAVHLAVALAGVAGVYLFGAFAIRLLFAPELAASVEATRLLSWVLLPVALGRAFSFYVLLPLRRDTRMTVAVAAGSLAMLALAVALAPAHGAPGMAAARVAGESVAAGLALLAGLRGLAALRAAAPG